MSSTASVVNGCACRHNERMLRSPARRSLDGDAPELVSARSFDGDTLQLLLHEPDRYGVWLWKNVWFNLWLAPAEGYLVDRMGQLTDEHRARFPRGMTAVHWVRPGAGLPTADGREALTRLAGRGDIPCVGVILSGAGFWASAMRSLVTGIRLMSGGKFSMRINASIEELAEWFPAAHQAYTGIAIDKEDLIHAVAHARNETLSAR